MKFKEVIKKYKNINTLNIPINVNIEFKIINLKVTSLYFSRVMLDESDLYFKDDIYSINIPECLKISKKDNLLILEVDNNYIEYLESKMLLKTIYENIKNIIKDLSEFYKGVINLKGVGYSVVVKKLEDERFELFFRFGFKTTNLVILPKNIRIENYLSISKSMFTIFGTSRAVIHKKLIEIRNLSIPTSYKLQGVYLNNKFPTVKKFIK